MPKSEDRAQSYQQILMENKIPVIAQASYEAANLYYKHFAEIKPTPWSRLDNEEKVKIINYVDLLHIHRSSKGVPTPLSDRLFAEVFDSYALTLIQQVGI